jgi:hypothetical protein
MARHGRLLTAPDAFVASRDARLLKPHYLLNLRAEIRRKLFPLNGLTLFENTAYCRTLYALMSAFAFRHLGGVHTRKTGESRIMSRQFQPSQSDG